ncbi:MAG: SEFIR domain-containing protein [Candidatus Zixiibacteriota bacterium]
MSPPKLFISYSWSDSTHEQWVVDLATELRESGVDVIFDKWDLKEGHDAVAFMEKMVTDSDIKKVAIITDETYAEKADGRAGGVGTETQIISKEIYDDQEQDKFVAVVSQKDENGKPYLPTYYKSRIYIDLSEPDNYGENFEQLLRWIFDKPLYVKPKIGKTPSFLEGEEAIALGTTASFKRAIDAIKKNKASASGSIDEYLGTFSENLEKFRIENPDGEFDDSVITNIENFIPYRNELIQLFISINQYSPSQENANKIHKFFESIISYMNKPEHQTSYRDWDFDNFKFIVHELFLYAMGIFIKFENFHHANSLLEQKYYLPGNSDYGRDVMVGFGVFRRYMKSLEYRNKRLKLRRLSLRADLLKQRCSGVGTEFRHLMQADFVIFMRAEIEAEDDLSKWWPETLLWLDHYHSPFEIFARSISKNYFDRVKVMLAIDKPSGLDELLQSYKENKRSLPRWQGESFSPLTLLGYEKLATLP